MNIKIGAPHIQIGAKPVFRTKEKEITINPIHTRNLIGLGHGGHGIHSNLLFGTLQMWFVAMSKNRITIHQMSITPVKRG